MRPFQGLSVRGLIDPDTRDRYRLVATLAGEASSVVDVGGLPGILATWLPGARVTTVNVEPPADVLVEGVELPFADGAFDVAISADVLEHLSPSDRPVHLQELARVAGRRVVVCCPLGGDRHDAAERELADWYERITGERHRFLDEHLRMGLPTEAELRELAGALPWPAELLFQGDFRRVQRIFQLTRVLRRRIRPLVALRLATLLGRPMGPLHTGASAWTNRAFLVADAPVGSQSPVLA